jgi:UDP-N-acetyl-D-galactosamine dehydrogenase
LPKNVDAIVAAVSHCQYLTTPLPVLTSLLKPGGVFVDVKSAYDPLAIANAGYVLWRL